MIEFNTVSNLIDVLNATFAGSLEVLVIITVALSALSFGAGVIAGFVQEYKKYTWKQIVEEEEVIECLSAEDCSLQEYMDGKVQVFKQAKSGAWYARRKIQVQVPVQDAIVDAVEYSAEPVRVEMDAGVMNVDMAQYVQEKVECVKMAISRFQVLQVIPAIVMVMAFVLPVAEKADGLINMPTQIETLKAEVVKLKNQAKVESVRQQTADVQFLLDIDPTDVVDPKHLS